MKAVIGVLMVFIAGTAFTVPPDTVRVGSAAELSKALSAAKAGDTIELAAGNYAGAFSATAKGTESAPITLTGPREAVLSNDKGGYGIHLDGAAYWNLTGFSVRKSAKGIVLDGSGNNTIDDVEIADIDAEAVHFRGSSSDNTIQNSNIHDTGYKQPQYGEAIYFGSAKSNWPQFGTDNGKGPDKSDRNQVIGNKIGPGVTAENVDIKEGTENGVLRGNIFDGHGISGDNYADSWVDVKGNGYTIESNTGTFDGSGALVDGYQLHQVVDGYGCANTFRANKSDLGGAEGYAIDVTDQKKCHGESNIVYSDNTVSGSGSGLTNIPTSAGSGRAAWDGLG